MLCLFFMARIYPFQAYRYSPGAGDPACLLTQPYDKISPEMQERYLSLSPYNLAHIIRGRVLPGDSANDNVYRRAARYLKEWIAQGVLVRDPQPEFFAYFQRFEAAGALRLRKGLVGLGAVEDYSQGIVFRHELTHSGPKRDRLELLRQTRAHFGQLFMLYDDPSFAVEALLDEAAAQSEPVLRVTDEYGAEHLLWPVCHPEKVAAIQRLLEPHRLLIADGHHRYETALAFRNENPGLPGADRVMMTLVNMRSPGLVVLPTHRVVGNIPDFQFSRVLRQAGAFFAVEEYASLGALEERLRRAETGQIVLGAVFQGDPNFYAFEADNNQVDNLLPELSPAERRLDVVALHQVFFARVLGLTPESVRDERNLRYVRGYEEAAACLEEPNTQAVFFLNPVRVEQVAEVAFSGGVMPQKSTDFFPKLLSGVAVYKLE
jgi:uncharacterized protein (DUF1015 family)